SKRYFTFTLATRDTSCWNPRASSSISLFLFTIFTHKKSGLSAQAAFL
ncbi:MAG: hypothetical protein ACI9WR_001705, partial [Paracoccaceae bacterium]